MARYSQAALSAALKPRGKGKMPLGSGLSDFGKSLQGVAGPKGRLGGALATMGRVRAQENTPLGSGLKGVGKKRRRPTPIRRGSDVMTSGVPAYSVKGTRRV